MGLLATLLRGSRINPDHGPDAVKPALALGGIAYDAELVDQLKEEHQELVRIFSLIKAAASECRFDQLPELLSELKLAFQTHIMLENVKLYVYLQQHCGADPETSNFISEVRKDMDGITRALVRFVNAHSTNVPTLETAPVFKAELEEIGNALLWRVMLEEGHLYSLYHPNY